MFDAARERSRTGFKLVIAASARHDEFFGENDWDWSLPEVPIEPERLEAAERRKAAAKSAERAKAGDMKYCK